MRLISFMILLICCLSGAEANAASTAQIKNKIIEKSIADYLATYAVCPCPYSKDKYDKPCGQSNAWTVSGHHSVYCYASDIPDSVVQEYRH